MVKLASTCQVSVFLQLEQQATDCTHVICVDGNDIVRRVARHVLVQHGEDVDTIGGVAVEDVAGTEETTLFTAVKVKLESVAWCVSGGGERPESFEDGGNAL